MPKDPYRTGIYPETHHSLGCWIRVIDRIADCNQPGVNLPNNRRDKELAGIKSLNIRNYQLHVSKKRRWQRMFVCIINRHRRIQKRIVAVHIAIQPFQCICQAIVTHLLTSDSGFDIHLDLITSKRCADLLQITCSCHEVIDVCLPV